MGRDAASAPMPACVLAPSWATAATSATSSRSRRACWAPTARPITWPIGDAEIGARVNVGAGTITCNYDGVNKHRTVIEDDAFIGSDTQLVAPVRVGQAPRWAPAPR